MKKKEEVPVIATPKVEVIPLVKEMEEAYLAYAMSVIVARALPDARDGLKPVQRRILYAMHTLGLKPQAKFRKSAAVTGGVMAKYHPHGNAPIYEAMVRMAQDFSYRYPLVWGQGNFGSLDGDPPAAERYTEAKLKHIATSLLADIEKETVKFAPNYDGTDQEPTVLPTRVPNLLLNGSVGIAVGMATNIPPHNLGELCDALLYVLDHPEATVQELMEFIKGPDFPTGGIIYNKKDIAQAYATGRGRVVMRGKTEIVEEKNGQFRILITEIPYQVNKASLVEKIADLVKEKKLEGIKYLGDESSKEGIRVVVELKKDVNPQKVLMKLFKMTSLQETFHFNMVALHDGLEPKIYTLPSVLQEFVQHRKDVIVARTKFDLAKAKARAHILEGLKKALDVIDQVIKTIKKSKDREQARLNLEKNFEFSTIQANAILDMRLQQLANLETQKIVDELKEKMDLIEELESILASEKKVIKIIKTEIDEVKQGYGDERRTKLVARAIDEMSDEDLEPNVPVIVVLTKDGYIKRMSLETFKQQGRGGKGVMGLTTKEDDVVNTVLYTTTHSTILCFTIFGRLYRLRVFDIPEASRTSKGQSIVNFLSLSSAEKVTALLGLTQLNAYKYLVMVTKLGQIKKTDVSLFENVRSNGVYAIKLDQGDVLQWVKPSTGEDDVLLITSKGQSIRFLEEDVRGMGRVAMGVRGIRLKENDEVVSMDVISPAMKKHKPMMLVATEFGYGKITSVNEYRVQGRGGSGIKAMNVTSKTGKIIKAMIVDTKNIPEGYSGDLLVVSKMGQVIRMDAKEIRVTGRVAQGVRIMRFKKEGDTVSSLDLI